MKKILISLLVLAVAVGTAGCGTGPEKTAVSSAEAGGSAEIVSSSEDPAVEGTWQTASIVQNGDAMQPEYYVQFAGLVINYGHMSEAGEFVLDHSDKISSIEETIQGVYTIKAEASSGVKYTYRTSAEDASVMEYYETWDEDEFSEKYSGGASLSKCE